MVRKIGLRSLSSAVAAPVDHLFSSEELPYEKLADTLRSHDLLPTFEAEEVERYRKASPEELQEHFGNNAYDFGLACELDEAVFVSDRQATLDYEPEAHEPTVITSASLLRALVKEGIVGKEAADRAAAINDRFGEWRDAPIVEVPSRVVISAFALPYWFQTGLLTSFDEGWLRGEPGWPRLRVGPFARKHLLEQAREQRIKKMKIDAAARLYAILHQLIANGVVTVLPDKDTVSEADSHRLHLRKLWPRALSSLHLAQRHNLNVWSDDRVIGYLLWPFGHPLPIPEITQEVRMIRQNHSEVHLRTTEDLLEILRDEGHLQEHLAEELGFELLRYGYRPLRFRLALLYLFRDFAYKTGSPRYEPLLQALRMLVSDPEPSTDDEAGPFPGIDPEPLQRLVLITIIPDLIATVWFAPVHRTNEERQALADDLLSLATEQLEARGEELEDGPASFWVTLLGQLVVHSFDANSQQDEKNTASRRAEPMSTSEEQSDTSAEDVSDIQLQEALDWFTDVLVRHEKGERRQLVVRGIEDYLVDLLRSQVESFLSDMPDICSEGEAEGNQTRIELRSRATAAIIERLQPYLYPLFNSELLNDVDPLFRRALGVLACAEGRYKTQHLVPVAGGDYKLKVEEEEEEQFALRLVLDAMQGDWDAARMVKADLTVDCVWNRPVPEEQRIDQPDFPEQHQVPVKISLVSLLLRNDVHNYPNLAEVVLSQLQLIDPSFGQELLRLRVDLLSDDEDIRRSGRERLAFALLRSPFFELQRDLAHGIRQLRKIDTEHLENFLAPQEGWFDEENNTATVAINGREHPIAMTTDLTVLCANPGTLYEAAKREAELILQQHEDDDLERRLAVLAKTTCEICSPFQTSYLLLTALIIAARLDKQASFAFGSQEWTLGDWISSYLQHVLNASLDSASSEMDYDRSVIRPPHLKVVHACILRLTANVAGSSNHIQTWQKELEDDEEVLCQWAHATLAFAARLLPLLIGRYGTDVLLKEAIEEAVYSLNIAYDDPIKFPDRFNPLLLGPHLLDHEVAAVFYVLTVFISHNQEAASVLDLEALRVSTNQWINEERSEAEQIYEAQQERAYNALNLQVPLSQQVAASRLLDVLGRV